MSKFEKGNPGGPGRPPGRTAASAFFDKMGSEAAEEILQTVLGAARAGNLRAAEIVLTRLWPQRKGAPVNFTLPRMEKPQDLVTAQAALIEAMGEGALTPEEGASVSAVLKAHRAAIETTNLEARIVALEKEVAGPNGYPS